MAQRILINRAPVPTLWGAVVAERMGYDRETALSLGKCLAGLNAQTKGRLLGIYGPSKGAESGWPARRRTRGPGAGSGRLQRPYDGQPEES